MYEFEVLASSSLHPASWLFRIIKSGKSQIIKQAKIDRFLMGYNSGFLVSLSACKQVGSLTEDPAFEVNLLCAAALTKQP